MSDWRVAKALLQLRDQINTLAPNRSKSSDGSIGDAAHASRSSDHNPWVKDGSMGVVTAIDVTNDPKNGVDCNILAERLRAHAVAEYAANKKTRLKYIIWNRRIASPTVANGTWRPYSGSNPHDHHMHISVNSGKADYDSMAPWDIGEIKANPAAPTVVEYPTLRKGAKGEDVRKLQVLLGITADGDYGTKTAAAVREYQTKNGLYADGVAGTYTWKKLIEKPVAPEPIRPRVSPSDPASPATFDKFMSWVFEDEGGMTISSDEPGGASNLGVSITAYSEYLGRKVTQAELARITEPEAQKFYFDKYFSPLHLEGFDPGVAYALFDYAVNSGTGAARTAMAATSAVKDVDDRIDAIIELRLSALRASKLWSRYGKGWTNRINRVSARAKSL